jgi:hypothetical protein
VFRVWIIGGYSGLLAENQVCQVNLSGSGILPLQIAYKSLDSESRLEFSSAYSCGTAPDF